MSQEGVFKELVNGKWMDLDPSPRFKRTLICISCKEHAIISWPSEYGGIGQYECEKCVDSEKEEQKQEQEPEIEEEEEEEEWYKKTIACSGCDKTTVIRTDWTILPGYLDYECRSCLDKRLELKYAQKEEEEPAVEEEEEESESDDSFSDLMMSSGAVKSEQPKPKEQDDEKDLLMSSKHLATYPHYFQFKPTNKRKTITAPLIPDLQSIVAQYAIETWKVVARDLYGLLLSTQYFSCKEFAEVCKDMYLRDSLQLLLDDMSYFESEPHPFSPFMEHLESHKREDSSTTKFRLKDSIHDRETIMMIIDSLRIKYLPFVSEMIPDIFVTQVVYEDNLIKDHLTKIQKT